MRPAQGSSAAVAPSPSASAAATNSLKATQTAPPGTPGTFRVRRLQLTFTEPAHPGPSGESLGPRTLIIQLWYPAGSARGRWPLPLILFAPGFQQCANPYGDLLSAWASAGYVVAGVNFPHSDCKVATATEDDMINQPGDMSYALTRLLALSQRAGDAVSGLIDRREVAAAGQSDGGDTVAALAANTCCEDRRLTAVAVLSGAEWAPMPGRYFAGTVPPMLFVQGSADTVNPPWTSVQLYEGDSGAARYYLDLFGADHTGPYWGTNKTEQIVVRVTVAFFDRYVLGRKTALAVMTRDGNVTGSAAMVSAGAPVPSG
ncbi:alpha/beta hydrolase [Trebonia kvetii]|uniref:poly(ethylene terephthalate) hydrolase n=1 Tax=Trebonia kvetii TaxID=2480626 RepID=A0A6P2BTG6_9ACTN|nr:alpha/beta hydrolase [Trebonia kvetii]TVZ02270.1 alpha/beta hydrolase [Trebonia kvetii]